MPVGCDRLRAPVFLRFYISVFTELTEINNRNRETMT